MLVYEGYHGKRSHHLLSGKKELNEGSDDKIRVIFLLLPFPEAPSA